MGIYYICELGKQVIFGNGFDIFLLGMHLIDYLWEFIVNIISGNVSKILSLGMSMNYYLWELQSQ